MSIEKHIHLVVSVLMILIAATFAGCKAEIPVPDMNADASIGNFMWGSSRVALIELAEKEASQKGFSVNSGGDTFVSLNGYPIFGGKADITFITTSFSPDDYPTLSERTERLLTGANISVRSADKADIIAQIGAILGEQETKQLHFYDHAGDIGYEYGSDLKEADYYWHGEQNIIESLGMDKLKSLYPQLDEKSIMKAFFATYEYTVRVRDNNDIENMEEGTVLITIEASPTVVKDILSN